MELSVAQINAASDPVINDLWIESMWMEVIVT
jgi:hypothetical protein